jgi:hypothetical protein
MRRWGLRGREPITRYRASTDVVTPFPYSKYKSRHIQEPKTLTISLHLNDCG